MLCRTVMTRAGRSVGRRAISCVEVIEVGPRDGLQNEKVSVPTDVKVALCRSLVDAGVRRIETTSYVSPKWVPQMSDNVNVMDALKDIPSGVEVSVLTPNLKGLENAKLSGRVDAVSVFGAASESFSQKNINCSIEESIGRFSAVAETALGDGLKVRGYVSCIAACPYEGPIDPKNVVKVWKLLKDLGCYEVSLGDTIGVATPNQISKVIEALVAEGADVNELAGHYHDTCGTALTNVLRSLDLGLSKFDSSAAGLGGCPYAAGASGNLATEDLVYLCDGLGIDTGIDFGKVVRASEATLDVIGIGNRSKSAQAWQAKKQT